MPPTPARRSTRCCALGAGVEDEGGGRVLIRGVGLHAPLETTGGAARRRQLRDAAAAAAGLARRSAGRRVDARRRRVDPPPSGRPDRRSAAPDGRADRRPRRPAAAADGPRRRAARRSTYELPMASAQVKSCVLIAGMLADGSTTIVEGRVSRDHTERILARSRVPFERDGLTDHGLPGRRARARRDRRARRPVVGRVHGRRRLPGARLARGGRQRRPQLDPLRLLPDRPADGRGDRRRARGAGRVQRRRAGRRPRRRPRPARRHRGRRPRRFPRRSTS